MSFGEAIATCFRKYADFTGRAARPEYWWFYLFISLVSFGLMFTWIGSIDRYDAGFPAGAVLNLLFGLAVFIPGLASSVRRLHDTNKSGWAIFISLVPFIGGIILIVWLATEGTPGNNQFGPPPTH